MNDCRRVCADEVSSAEFGRLILAESPRGEIELPKAAYDLIAADLPRCLERGDDDRRATPHFPSLCLKRVCGTTVKLITRNTPSIGLLLQKKGFRVQILRSFGDPSCTTPKSILLWTVKRWSKHVLDAAMLIVNMLTYYRAGVFISRDRQCKYDQAAILCAAFDETPIVFVVGSHDEVNLVTAELQARLVENIHRGFGIHAGPQSRITVATFAAFESEDLFDAPIVIVPIWKPGYPMWMKRLIFNPYRDRVYFLLTVADKLSDQDADDLAGRVGPILLQPEKPVRGITTFSTFQFGGRIRSRDNSRPRTFELFDERTLYWRHRPRNQAIAAIARCVEIGDGAVAILVENLDHAEHLSRLLPDWTVVQKDAIPTSEPARMIVTLTAADSWEQFHPETILVGMGGPASSWLIGSVERISHQGKSIRIIDVTDGFDDAAGRFAAARMNAYRRAGWHWRPLDGSLVRAVGQAIRVARPVKQRSLR